MKKILWVCVLIITACSPLATTEAPAATVEAKPPVTETPAPTLSPDEPPPSGATREFSTDFSKHSVPYSEIFSGGPPKDGIPAVDNPKFITVEKADPWLRNPEPVIFVEIGEDARAYPVQILIWHEIVNDTVGDVPVTVTFCPLCNTAIAFERTVDDLVLDFGTTGRLRFSNLIMYDRQTETWWQQATGEAIVGELLGTQLKFVPASIISWEDFSTTFPDGMVLSDDTGFDRPYGRNPYVGYDDIDGSPFLFRGNTPGVLSPMERVLALELNGDVVAYPYSALSSALVFNDNVGGEPVVVFWMSGTASPLDTSGISDGRDVGAASAYSPVLDGEQLIFEAKDGTIRDTNTGSEWNIFGIAVSGPLEGKALTPLPAFNHFWFDWVAFKPETRVYQP